MNVLAYPAKDGRNPEVLKIIEGGDYTLMGLERQFGVSKFLLLKHYGAKSTGRGRPKKPKPLGEPKKRGRPPKVVAPALSQAVSDASLAPAQPNPKKDHFRQPAPMPVLPSYSPSLIGAGLIGLGIIAGAVGGFINWRYSYALGGQDQLISLACGMIGIVVDGAQQLLLPAIVPLWKKRHRIGAAMAFLAWLPFLAGSTYAALGFVGVSIGDVIQARKVPITQRGQLTAQLNGKVAIRKTIEEVGDQKVLENLMNLALGSVPMKNRISSKDCKEPTLSSGLCKDYIRLHDAYVAANARDDIDAIITSLTAQINALPAIGSANPAAEQLAQITGGGINSEQASNYQVRWLAVVPGTSSILLTLGLALL